MSEIEKLLAGALRTMSSARTCWLVTRDAAGLASPRPMGGLGFDPAAFDWTLRFLADRRTGKARNVDADPDVVVLYQHGEEAFVSINGTARMVTDAADVAARWLPAYERFFRRDAARENAAFIEVVASRMQLWIRGVTPEPFGMRTTELRRQSDGRWILAP